MTRDPEAWPHSPSADPAAEAVRSIAHTLTAAMTEGSWSLRRVAAGSGVNRQAIADLLAGRSWPDIATVARLTAFTGTPLWPTGPGTDRKREH
ncbi:helix-turn-helix domain-containing protein [Streptomyces sp. JH002]|uniref:helix-turn-helix domain-containing protein n=1 Tax=Streptomyces sp. JH002 TaxID=2763259 RepID=UPI003D801E73